jgi:hypothetical protein
VFAKGLGADIEGEPIVAVLQRPAMLHAISLNPSGVALLEFVGRAHSHHGRQLAEETAVCRAAESNILGSRTTAGRPRSVVDRQLRLSGR